MKFPHIFRNYYRKFISNCPLIIRLIIVLMITGSFLEFSIQSGPQNSTLLLGKVKSASVSKKNANTHIIEASKYIRSFHQNHDTQNLKLAREELQTALELDPKNTFALKELENIRDIDTTLAKQEIGDVQEILNKQPDYALAWTKLAILYEILGENDLAVKAIKKASSLNSNL